LIKPSEWFEEGRGSALTQKPTYEEREHRVEEPEIQAFARHQTAEKMTHRGIADFVGSKAREMYKDSPEVLGDFRRYLYLEGERHERR
jgi:hypothetical protein